MLDQLIQKFHLAETLKRISVSISHPHKKWMTMMMIFVHSGFNLMNDPYTQSVNADEFCALYIHLG